MCMLIMHAFLHSLLRALALKSQESRPLLLYMVVGVQEPAVCDTALCSLIKCRLLNNLDCSGRYFLLFRALRFGELFVRSQILDWPLDWLPRLALGGLGQSGDRWC